MQNKTQKTMEEKSKDKSKETPMMRQYKEIKGRYQDEVVFFRMGDFYEMFFEDAVYASAVLNIALTRRQDGIPMCGVPHHALKNYVHPILEDGKKIAICDQMEDPAQAKGIVKRDVTRILTPGSLYEESLLPENDRRLISSVVPFRLSGSPSGVLSKGSSAGPSDHKGDAKNGESGSFLLAVADVSTGDLWITKSDNLSNDANLHSRGVREIVVEDINILGQDIYLPVFERNYFLGKRAPDIVAQGFGETNIGVLELNEIEIKAIALLFSYIREIMPNYNSSWQHPVKEYSKNTLILDESAIRTLEVVKSQSGQKKDSLFGVLDYTRTAGGKRMLLDYLSAPSGDKQVIEQRQDFIEYAIEKSVVSAKVQETLRGVYDIERLISSTQNIPQVRQLGQLRDSLQCIRDIQAIYREVYDEIDSSDAVKKQSQKLSLKFPEKIEKEWIQADFPNELESMLKDVLKDHELPPVLDERRFVREGYDPILDDLFFTAQSASEIIIEFEKSEKVRLGITTLRVKYNRVIGYFVEISKGQIAKAPEDYVRRQTLVNAERYTCEKLKDLENKILNAREDIIKLQRKIFDATVLEIINYVEIMRVWAKTISSLDVLLGFAEAARTNQYVRPKIVTKGDLQLKKSRHPVVEVTFRDEIFVPNDVHLNNTNRHLAILTGPNMAGKSTYIRQVGLIQIMAQTGSFIPAESGQVPIVDRVYTRIGAYDRLFRGESTFYVEMSECARIFTNYTENSLILLDEVGRGTSTFDGISIARSMIEYLNRSKRGRPKTLFATHYAELSQMIEADNGIIGLTVNVLEEKDRIVFLRNIVEGSADKSYGIYVAELAGLKKDIVERASELLNELEEEGFWNVEPKFAQSDRTRKRQKKSALDKKDQPSMFE